jgi:hypothetical protein
MPPYRSNRAGPVRIDPKPFPVPVDPASLLFTDRAVRQIAKIAFERGTGARGLRSVIEEVLEGVLFDVEAGFRYVITDKTVRDGEPMKHSMAQMRAPLGSGLNQPLASGKNRCCWLPGDVHKSKKFQPQYERIGGR